MLLVSAAPAEVSTRAGSYLRDLTATVSPQITAAILPIVQSRSRPGHARETDLAARRWSRRMRSKLLVIAISALPALGMNAAFAATKHRTHHHRAAPARVVAPPPGYVPGAPR